MRITDYDLTSVKTIFHYVNSIDLNLFLRSFKYYIMKKQLKKSISLKKLTVARINDYGMRKIQGGDCLATEHCDQTNNCESDVYCDHSHIP